MRERRRTLNSALSERSLFCGATVYRVWLINNKSEKGFLNAFFCYSAYLISIDVYLFIAGTNPLLRAIHGRYHSTQNHELFFLVWRWIFAKSKKCFKSKLYEGVSKSFRTKSITKYRLTTINTRWEGTQRVMAAKLTRLTYKIAIQLHLVAENCTICSSRSRRPVRKLLDPPW
jgi:hypothetical protein